MRSRFRLLPLVLASAAWVIPPGIVRSAELPAPAGGWAVRETRLPADVADGRRVGFSLIEAALTAEGVRDPKEIERLLNTFSTSQREVAATVSHVRAPDRRAALVLKWMHSQILRGRYDAGCDELTRTIHAGDYNCVTATVVYLALGRHCGLPLTAVQLPGHVRVRLTGAVPGEIETTGPTGYPQFARESTGGETQAGSTVTRPAQSARPLSDTALVAKIYYNRGIRLFQDRRFPEAIAATASALTLDPSDTAARSNLLAAYNNWALAPCAKSEFADAAALVAHARQLGPHYAPLASNDLHIHQQWILQLCEAGRFADALAVLERGYRRRPDAELFDEGREAVRRWWFESLGTVTTATAEMD